MTFKDFLSRRSFLQASAVSAELGRARISAAHDADRDGGGAAIRLPTSAVSYRDPAPGGVEQPLARLLDHDGFINAFRFLTSAEIDDAAGYRGRLDLTSPVQRALDAAWSTNRDLFLPAGLYRVSGLVLPGGAAQRSRAFRFFGQGSGELFARREDGGTIIKGTRGASVLRSAMTQEKSGNGNQEIAYIRFEGDAAIPVLDLETLFAQSELHHCGIYQAGSGDGVRVRWANTIEIHHNYVLNDDWLEPRKRSRTGTGIRLTASGDNGLMTLRKNTARGFEWGIWLGGRDTGVLYSPRVEQCEASVCANGIRFEDVRGGVIENCYLEGGDGGTGIFNLGNGNTLSNNLIFPGFAVGIDDDPASQATRILGNTVSAGNARTVNPSGCTLVRTRGTGPAKLVQGNYLIVDPVSFGPVDRVIGLAVGGDEDSVVMLANAFDPTGSWGSGRGTAKIAGSNALARWLAGTDPFPAEQLGLSLAFAAPLLAASNLVQASQAAGDDRLVLPAGSWFDVSDVVNGPVRRIDGAAPCGAPVVLLDRIGALRVESGEAIRLADCQPFEGPGSLSLILRPGAAGTEAFEVARTRYQQGL